ncbi:MAG: type II toxin-antitoxin system VapB family antitoxin [Leptospiraceae bacterium]|nr:type II toxin-antitoxin system VapB family antitoxin [Leptospiraceae bacterium]
MKTTLYIPEELLQQAMEYSGIKEKTGVLQEGLRALIREKAAQRIRKLGGSDKKAKVISRRRSK